MAERHDIEIANGATVTVVLTGADDGDFRVLDPVEDLEARRREIVDAPWSWVRQVHGPTVLRVDQPGQHAGQEADGLLTTAVGCPVAVTTADCAPVVLVAERGVAAIHAGWRGLVAGIITDGAEQLRAAAGEPVATLLGPCIHPGAYQFGRAELDDVIDRLGPTVESRTEQGDIALDMPAAVAAACEQAGWPAPSPTSCTSDDGWFSHRTRADRGRQTAVAWIQPAEPGR